MKRDEIGFLTFAMGEEYLRMAYAQALTVKIHNMDNFAVIVDSQTEKFVTTNHRDVFDEIIVSTKSYNHPMELECTALELTPWKETIKTDADMLFNSSIIHWVDTFRLKDIVFTTNVYDYKKELITNRLHRKLFDKNRLPNIYTALWYFRYTQKSTQLFEYAKIVTRDWDYYASRFLKNNKDKNPRTDEIFSIAALLLGVEECTIPSVSIPSFVHMKEELNNLSNMSYWYDQLYFMTGPQLQIGFNDQILPFHYFRKKWLSEDHIKRLEDEFYRKSTI